MKYFCAISLGVIVLCALCFLQTRKGLPIASSGDTNVQEESVEFIKNDTFIAAVMSPALVRIAANVSSPDGIGINSIKGQVTENETLVFAANGGMYDVNYKPIGLCVINGKTVQDVAKIGTEGNFNLKFGNQPTNGIFMIDKSHAASIIPSIQYDNDQTSTLYATQSGPLMLLNGGINSNFTQGSNNLNIRNGVGIDNKGNVVLIMSNALINFYDFACLFRDRFHCQDALYLDGIVSRTYCPSEGYNMDGSSFGVITYVIMKK